MKNEIKTLIGTFTMDTYEIPKGYINSEPFGIYQKEEDIYRIVTIFQSIEFAGVIYTPILFQNCMKPDEITIYPLSIEVYHHTVIIKDRYRKVQWEIGKSVPVIHPWYPVIKKLGCVPCRNCGRC